MDLQGDYFQFLRSICPDYSLIIVYFLSKYEQIIVIWKRFFFTPVQKHLTLTSVKEFNFYHTVFVLQQGSCIPVPLWPRACASSAGSHRTSSSLAVEAPSIHLSVCFSASLTACEAHVGFLPTFSAQSAREEFFTGTNVLTDISISKILAGHSSVSPERFHFSFFPLVGCVWWKPSQLLHFDSGN